MGNRMKARITKRNDNLSSGLIIADSDNISMFCNPTHINIVINANGDRYSIAIERDEFESIMDRYNRLYGRKWL